MEKSKVVLLPCSSYDEEAVYEALRQGLTLLGGLEQFVSPGERVLVKPNLLKNAAPEKAITTHPSVFGAMLRCLREAGIDSISYGDSPGPAASLEKAVEEGRLREQAEKYGAVLGDFSHAEPFAFPEGKNCKKFMLCPEVKKADAVISLCKMKTHALENITGAVKNQYGCIYGSYKAAGHAMYPNSRSFADMLCDLNRCVAPRLFLMDGIIAMEGNGPASGTPKPMKVLLLSADPVALDSVFAKLVDLDPHNVPTCVSGAKSGLGKMEYGEISILTLDGEISAEEAFRKYGAADFDVKRKKSSFWRVRSLFPASKKYSDRPVVDPEKCIACGICQQACPVDGQAVHSGHGQKASYDYSKCIRCYCCQEMCPVGAITRK